MLLSMTGFGKAVAEADGKKITVEIKSLNSKQLDLSLRLLKILFMFLSSKNDLYVVFCDFITSVKVTESVVISFN